MVTPQILDYISKRRMEGVKDLTIMQDLTAAGWNIKDIDDAFSQLSGRIIEGVPSHDNVRSALSASLILGAIGFLILAAVVYINTLRIFRIVNPIDRIQKVSEEKNETDLVSVRTSLSFYFVKNERYPETLEEILNMDDSLVKDKYVLNKFDYVSLNNGQHYRLCIEAASGDQVCTTDQDSYTGFGPEPAQMP